MIIAQVLLLSLLGLANVFTAFATSDATADAKDAMHIVSQAATTATHTELIAVVGGPTANPTTTPTASPSQQPTARPSALTGPYELFAVVGSNACAEELTYGPATLTETGSSDGYSMYFSTSTSSGQQPRTDWLQIVTLEGSGELFRIYWTFSTAKTLADRFVNAPTNGESVSYRVVDTAGVAGLAGTEYLYTGTWRFSDGAAITASKFTNASTTSTGFSADDGAWGAAPSVINAKAGVPLNFWGVGNFYGQDYPSCNNVYANGNIVYSYWHYSYTVKVYMYINTETVPSFSTQAISSHKAVTVSPRGTITGIIEVVVSVLVLFVLAYCCRQHLGRLGSPRGAGRANGKSVVVTIGGYDLGDVEVQVVSVGEDGGATASR